MKYQDAASLRRRRNIAFDRVIARIVRVDSDGFFLKGGLALAYRFGNVVRRTVDMDFSAGNINRMRQIIRSSVAISLDDFFELRIAAEPTEAITPHTTENFKESVRNRSSRSPTFRPPKSSSFLLSGISRKSCTRTCVVTAMRRARGSRIWSISSYCRAWRSISTRLHYAERSTLRSRPGKPRTFRLNSHLHRNIGAQPTPR